MTISLTRRKPGRRIVALLAIVIACAPLDAQDEALQKRIDAAVDKGREHLLGRLAALTRNTPRDYPMGRVALPLAACLKAGADTDDARVKDALDKLRRMPLSKTYSVSCYLFALDALALRQYKERVSESRRGRTYVAAGGASHRARGRPRAEMVKCINWLVAARAESMGYWNYHALASSGPQGHDFSNSQFAVLGLQIGLEHAIPIPRKVFEEIANIFVKSQHLSGEPEEAKVSYGLNLEDLLKGGRSRTRVAGASFKVRPGGWQYRATNKGSKASMTAAGASSLLVARNGLANGSRLKKAVEKAIARSYLWIDKNFNSYMSFNLGGHGLYTIYSLEKVGDLGDIERFGEHDWYVEGAEKLLAAQKGDGSWGPYVNTSFALLFLTRATRLKPYAAPKITTRAQGKGGDGMKRGLVFIDRLGGFVAATDILGLLEQSRDASLVTIGQEVVRNYNPSQHEDLVPELMRLWTRSNDRVTRFAKDALEEITGVRSSKRAEYQLWIEQTKLVADLEKKSGVTVEGLSALLDKIESPTLKTRVINVASKRSLYGLSGRLVQELESPHHLYRMSVNNLLCLWSGRTVPSPDASDRAGWEDISRGWRTWASSEGTKLVSRSQLVQLVALLDAAQTSETAGIVDRIVALGSSVIPDLERVVEGDEFSFHLIEALEQLKGRPIGLR